MTDQSDYDLLLVVRSESDLKEARKRFSRGRSRLPRRPFDIVWMTEPVFNQKKATGGVAWIAVHEGRRLIEECK